MELRLITLRWEARCLGCRVAIPARERAWWDGETKTVLCEACHAKPEGEVGLTDPKPYHFGAAGASARRQYERKAARERARKDEAVARDAEWRSRVKQERPIIGRLQAAMTQKPVIGPESQATRAWLIGAAGEERVGELLAACPGVNAIHDLRIRGSRANIDHVAVGPTGVYVIDAKRYHGRLEKRDVGGWFRSNEQLFIRGRNRTSLVHAMERQVDEVRAALAAAMVVGDIPITPVLCFTGPEWPLLARPFTLHGVTILWPGALAKLVSRPGPLSAETVRQVALIVTRALPPHD